MNRRELIHYLLARGCEIRETVVDPTGRFDVFWNPLTGAHVTLLWYPMLDYLAARDVCHVLGIPAPSRRQFPTGARAGWRSLPGRRV